MTILRQAGGSFVVAVLAAIAILLFEQSGFWLKLEAAVGVPSSVQGISARLYGTIASLAGLFVSLYFTAVGFLTSALYGGASSELRSSALSERISNFYVRFVLWTGAISLCFLTAEALGYSTRSLALIIVSTAGTIALLAAGTLLGSTLRFFNPSSFAAEARRNLDLLFDYFETGSSLKHQKALQSAARKRARQIIGLFDEALRLCESENQSAALSEIGGHAAAILQSYWTVKPRLPSESGWWQPEPKSEGWFLADHTSIKRALKSGTSLRREKELDRLWAEGDLSSSLARALKNLVQERKWADGAELLEHVRKISNTGSEHFLIEEVQLLLSKLEAILLEYTDSEKGRNSQDRGVRSSDLWDMYGAVHVQMLVGARRSLEQIAPENIIDLISTIDWQDEASVSTTPVMPDLKERLELLGETLRFERVVEGRELSPEWYQAEFLLPGILEGLHERVNLLHAQISRLLEDVVAKLEEEGKHSSACQLAEKGLEIQSQWSPFVEDAREIDESLRKMIKADDFEYPDFDWEALDEDLDDAGQQVVDRFIDFAPDLLFELDNERAKELLGHIYSLITDRCAEAAISGSDDRFSELFDEAFNLGLFLWGRAPLKDVDLREWDQVRIGVQPVIDILALSGLALIRDEIDGPGFWKPVQESWNDFLNDSDSPREILETVFRVGDQSLTEFGVMPRSIIRTEWRQSMQDELRERRLLSGPGSGQRASATKRPLLDAVLAGIQGIEDPIDVFLGALIAVRPESIGLEWPQGAQSFLRRWTGKSYQ